MNDQPRVLPPDPALTPTPTQPIAATPPKQRFQDRLWSLRAVIAVALASVIIGGLGGAALANVSQDGGDVRRGHGFRGGPGGPAGPGMMNHGPRPRFGGPLGRNRFRDPQGKQQWKWQQRQGQPGQPGRPLTPAPSPSLPKPSD